MTKVFTINVEVPDGHHSSGEPQTQHPRLTAAIERLIERVEALTERITAMSVELERLTQEVAQTKTVSQSVLTLVEGLAQQIRDHINDKAALNALADELDANEQALANAVAANTPPPPGT